LRVLLTGGLGYIGGRLTESLLATGDHDVVLGTRQAAAAPAWAGGAEMVTIDWHSDAALERTCRNVDAIVHLAGMNATECARDPVAALATYRGGTARLVRAAASQQVRRILYVSSLHVYGDALTGDVDENTIPEPRHPYGVSHLAAEEVVRGAHGKGSLQGIVARLSNTFGAPADAGANCWSLLINDLCRQAARNRRMVLRTAGTQCRDFVAMSEACRAIVHLLSITANARDEGVFNVGSGTALTILQAARMVGDRVHAVLGLRPELEIGRDDDTVGKGLRSFVVERLAATGFVPRPAAMREELDRLAAFVAAERGRV
jgi:UDP-glucose 4-epimerase